MPSDHWGVEEQPSTNRSTTKTRPNKKSLMVRRTLDSLVLDFGQILAQKDWSFLDGQLTNRIYFKVVSVNRINP